MRVNIDGVEREFPAVNPFTYDGVHSGKSLRGMELVFVSRSEPEDGQIEALLRKAGTVTVFDPSSGEQYEATVDRQWSSSHTQGHLAKHYRFKVREVDRAKAFASLQIEGETFAVLKNVETTNHDGTVGIHALLRLSPEEFTTFLPLLQPGPVRVLRVGVDESPIERRFGSVADWSYHEEDFQGYYKQMVSFYDVSRPPSGLDMTRGQQHRALSSMVLALTFRFETLLEALESNGAISQEQVTTIMQDQWEELADECRRQTVYAQLDKVNDAEEEFERYEQDAY